LRADEAVEESSLIDKLEKVERNHIIRALNETNWVVHGKKGAAEILGINPSTLRSRMDKLGIKNPDRLADFLRTGNGGFARDGGGFALRPFHSNSVTQQERQDEAILCRPANVRFH